MSHYGRTTPALSDLDILGRTVHGAERITACSLGVQAFPTVARITARSSRVVRTRLIRFDLFDIEQLREELRLFSFQNCNITSMRFQKVALALGIPLAKTSEAQAKHAVNTWPMRDKSLTCSDEGLLHVNFNAQRITASKPSFLGMCQNCSHSGHGHVQTSTVVLASTHAQQ
jgi:hypothetical protein